MADDIRFCTECGKELAGAIPTMKSCSYCGNSMNDDDAFCSNCGNSFEGVLVSRPKIQMGQSYRISEKSSNSLKIMISIVLGLLALTILGGGGWYGYKEYSAYTEKKLAREKFVADSLEQAIKDSIKIVELKEKERLDSIENARILSLQRPYLELLDKYGAKEEHWEEFYFLYDINGDNFPEIWLQILENDEHKLLVYTNIKGEAKLLYKGISGFHNGYYKGDSYILKNYAHMGYQTIHKYYFQNDLIKEEKYFTLEAESFNEAVYKEITEPMVTTYEITDKTPIYDIK